MMDTPGGGNDSREASVNDLGTTAHLPPGTRLGPYQVEAFVAEGGMGEVYRAKDTRLGRTVAIKVLPARAASDESRRRRFEQEARAVSSLNHPHICVLYDFGCEPPLYSGAHASDGATLPVHFLVMEYLAGQTLAARLKKGALPPLQALEYGAQIADALHAAHRQGILHRDLKPGNIMLTPNGAKLMDFGLARLTESSDPVATTEALTLPGTVVGTVPYMAPEQLEGRPIDGRADLFALGAVIYEMVTGRRAFQGSALPSIIAAVLEHDPPPVTSLQPLAPPVLNRLIATCLAKDPERRWDSAHDLAEQLRALAAGDAAVTSSAVQVRPPVVGRAPRWLLPGAVAVVLILAAGALAFWRFGPHQPPPVIVPAPHQITTSATWDAEPALSPDGNTVAYSSGESGNADIYVADVRERTPLQLTSDAAWDSSPAWFPDGTHIAYVSDRDGPRSVWKIGRMGGTPILLVPEAEDPAISPDGKQIAFVRLLPSGDRRIAVAKLDDVTRERVITGDRDGLWDHRSPAWSPDGESICYRAQRDLWCTPAGGGGAHRLTTDGELDFEPQFTSDGRDVLFSSLRDGTQALWRVPAQGGHPVRVTVGAGPERHPSVSRDGKRLVYATFLDNFDLVLRDVASGGTHRYGSQRSEQHPALSPDGRTLYFVSDRLGKYDLWSQQLSGIEPVGQPRALTDYPGSVSMPTCSPDGQWVAFGRAEQARRQIVIIPASGGPASPLTDGASYAGQPAWSPHGSSIAFSSNRSGANQIWVMPVANGRAAGAARQLVPNGDNQQLPAWSPDASRIAFVEMGGHREVLVANASGPPSPERVTKGAQSVGARWLTADRLLVSGLWGSAAYSVRELSLVDRSVKPVAQAAGRADEAGLFDVTRDGRILVLTWEERSGNIWALEASSRIY